MCVTYYHTDEDFSEWLKCLIIERLLFSRNSQYHHVFNWYRFILLIFFKQLMQQVPPSSHIHNTGSNMFQPKWNRYKNCIVHFPNPGKLSVTCYHYSTGLGRNRAVHYFKIQISHWSNYKFPHGGLVLAHSIFPMQIFTWLENWVIRI